MNLTSTLPLSASPRGGICRMLSSSRCALRITTSLGLLPPRAGALVQPPASVSCLTSDLNSFTRSSNAKHQGASLSSLEMGPPSPSPPQICLASEGVGSRAADAGPSRTGASHSSSGQNLFFASRSKRRAQQPESPWSRARSDSPPPPPPPMRYALQTKQFIVLAIALSSPSAKTSPPWSSVSSATKSHASRHL